MIRAEELVDNSSYQTLSAEKNQKTYQLSTKLVKKVYHIIWHISSYPVKDAGTP